MLWRSGAVGLRHSECPSCTYPMRGESFLYRDLFLLLATGKLWQSLCLWGHSLSVGRVIPQSRTGVRNKRGARPSGEAPAATVALSLLWKEPGEGFWEPFPSKSAAFCVLVQRAAACCTVPEPLRGGLPWGQWQWAVLQPPQMASG